MGRNGHQPRQLQAGQQGDFVGQLVCLLKGGARLAGLPAGIDLQQDALARCV